jgi:hypothetical protein
MTLPRPVKAILREGGLDAPVSRGWSRVQRKRQVRDTARKSVLGVSCLVLAAAVGWAVRPYLSTPRPSAAAPLAGVEASAVKTAAPLDTLVDQLPKVHGRAVQVQRPVPAAPPAAPVAAPQPEVDVVGALLESVRDAYEHGDTARAAALLSEIAEKHEEDPRSAQALYVLGLIQLDKNHDAKGAAVSFNHALELDPPAELVPTLWEALERARAAK